MLQFSILVTLMAMLVALCVTADDMYRCEDGVFTCTKQAAYICASNGVSYLNHCEFFNAYCSNKDINFKHDGKCEDKATASSPPKQSKDSTPSTTGSSAALSGYSPAPAQQASGSAYNPASTPAPSKSSAETSFSIASALVAIALVLVSV